MATFIVKESPMRKIEFELPGPKLAIEGAEFSLRALETELYRIQGELSNEDLVDSGYPILAELFNALPCGSR